MKIKRVGDGSTIAAHHGFTFRIVRIRPAPRGSEWHLTQRRLGRPVYTTTGASHRELLKAAEHLTHQTDIFRETAS